MSNKFELNNITVENVKEFEEEEVFEFLTNKISALDKEQRSQYVKIISTSFDIRSVSVKNRGLRADLKMFGFKFFTIPNDEKFVMGIKRKGA